VIEAKVLREDDKEDDQELAGVAMNQIKEKKYGDAYLTPILLGMAINDKDRAIKVWLSEGGQGRSSSHAVDEN
ncbi:MAG: PD-(D/E)XK nuclease domain-containing protein, partial [Deltaproteobacteria bacterium]|nr:PD-(D/E)XK nuclease domain-containing protein [Deltaproteobacteria bacterium]